MKKSIFALLTAVALFTASLPVFPSQAASSGTNSAEGEDAADELYMEDVLLNYQQYCEDPQGYTWLLQDNAYSYILQADHIKSFNRKLPGMRTAYAAMDESLTEDDCIGYLAVVMQLLDSGMEAGIEAQAQYDSSKNWKGYAVDVVSLSIDAFGLGKAAEDLKKAQELAGIGGDSLKLVLESKENYQRFLTCVQNYEDHKAFLDAIARHAKNPPLKSAAQKLMDLTEYRYAYELDYLINSISAGGTIVAVKANEPLINDSLITWLGKLLKGEDLKKATSVLATAKKAMTLLKNINLGVGIGALIGDVFIGNEYRYLKELMILDDMTQALRTEILASAPDAESSTLARYDALKTHVPLLLSLCAVRTRGEYCANMIAQANDTLFGFFTLDDDEKTAVYNQAFAFQEREYKMISEIFLVDDFLVTLLWRPMIHSMSKTGVIVARLWGLYPELSYRGDPEAMAKIQNTLKAEAESSLNVYLSSDDWSNPDMEYFNRLPAGSYNLFAMAPVPETRMDRTVISILICERACAAGSAHLDHWYKHYNFDTKTGELLTLSDILTDSQAFEKLGLLVYNGSPVDCQSSQERELLAQNAWNSWSQHTPDSNPASWYFTAEGLGITYDPYIIAPYAAGSIHWVIPYNQLDGIIKEEYLSPEPVSTKGTIVEGEIVSGVDLSAARNYIHCDGPSEDINKLYHIKLASEEIVYNVCVYNASNGAFRDNTYQYQPLVTLSSLSPSTVLVVTCGPSTDSDLTLLVRWTDGHGNERRTLFNLDSSGILESNEVR